MMGHLDNAYKADIRLRLVSGTRPLDGVVIVAQDITEGQVYERQIPHFVLSFKPFVHAVSL